MSNHKNPDDITEAEIRYLLAKKLRSHNSKRLERFRRTGRLVELVPDTYPLSLENLFTQQDRSSEGNIRRRLDRAGKRLVEQFLLFAEVVVGVGILLLLIYGTELHHELNRKGKVGWILTEPTPTPLISAVELPSGHVHAVQFSEIQPKGTGIPNHLRPLVQPPAYLPPTPAPAPQHGTRIQIPAIKVDSPIVHGDAWEQLMKGVAHNVNSANPGQIGNIVLSGHNDIYGEVFRYLEELKAGDEIIIYTSQRAFTYIISGWELVEPTQVEVMAPTPDATITLISCHPYMVDNHRIIVKGSLKG